MTSTPTICPPFTSRTTAVKMIRALSAVTVPSYSDSVRRTPPHRAVPETIPKPCPNDQWFVSKPMGKLALFLWKKQIWLESTFALTVCEPWEEVVVLTIFAILALALFVAFAVYLPRQLVLMKKRAIYYLWGEGNMDLL